MNRKTCVVPRTLALCALICSAPVAGVAQSDNEEHWQIAGDLSEACTCSVPCTCNFGQSPSPHSFCWALFSLDIHQGNFGTESLNGLRLAGGNGGKGLVFYVDDRATHEQALALRQIAATMYRKMLKANHLAPSGTIPEEYRLLGYKRAHIEQATGDRMHSLKIGTAGAFIADYLIGIDGKTPVTVENNYSWNITHGIKAKARSLRYKDTYGNAYDYTQVNSNQGKFDWSDSTPVYFQ